MHQEGSHIILETSEPAHQRIAIPDHHPLRLGTFISVLHTVAHHKGVTRDAIIASHRVLKVKSRQGINPSVVRLFGGTSACK